MRDFIHIDDCVAGILATMDALNGDSSAEEFGGQWLPFGVDTGIFRPKPVKVVHDAAFLRTMYRKRAEYIGKVGYPIVHMQSVSSPSMCARRFAHWPTPIARRRSSSTSRPCLDCSLQKSPRSWPAERFGLDASIDHPSAYCNMEPLSVASIPSITTPMIRERSAAW